MTRAAMSPPGPRRWTRRPRARGRPPSTMPTGSRVPSTRRARRGAGSTTRRPAPCSSRPAPRGPRSATQYNASGLVTAEVDALGNRLVLGYDDRGNLARIEQRSSDAATLSVLDVTTDLLGRPVSTRSRAGGPLTTYAFDANDRLVAVTLADGTTRRWTYDACASTAYRNEAGTEMTLARADNLAVTATELPGGISTRYAYDADGDLSGVTDPRGATVGVRLIANAPGNTAFPPSALHLMQRAPDGRETRLMFDAQKQPRGPGRGHGRAHTPRVHLHQRVDAPSGPHGRADGCARVRRRGTADADDQRPRPAGALRP